MESADHQWLKRLGVSLLFQQGCSAVATEVRCPIHRFRVDVAGYVDALPKRTPAWALSGAERNGSAADGALSAVEPISRPLVRRRRERAFTCLIECKQSRADFLRDRRDLERLLHRRAALEREREHIERTRLREREPHLRRSGTCLFPELEEWDYHLSRDDVYLAVLRELDLIDRKLHGQTKFTRAARYRLADALLLLTPRGLIEPEEVPPGWGLLEADRDSGRVHMVAAAPEHDAGERRRLRVLRNIAIAASRRAVGLSDAPSDFRGHDATPQPA